MTYRELIEQCPNVGLNGYGCDNCECDKECDYFITIAGYVPSHYRKVVVELDLDKEIERKLKNIYDSIKDEEE